MSLPVTAAVLGMPQLNYIRQNTALARNFKPMSKLEMLRYSERISGVYKTALDLKFADHIDV